jgi:hypothetical protein
MSTEKFMDVVIAPNRMVTGMLTRWDGFSLEHYFSVGYNIRGMGSCPG